MPVLPFKENLLEQVRLDGRRCKIVVAMSGGVDSSVVAALMKEAGHEVIGVTLQLYDHGVALSKKGACCAGIDIYDAQMAAEAIGIPHYVFNYESRFREEVILPFADSYMRGETPIPCILCNQKVKFRDLLRSAMELDADYMATGHYIQRRSGAMGSSLYRAIDPQKDQSYFLFATTQEQIDRTLFPLGGLYKEQTRQLAASYGLEIAAKPDSQDICFVPNGDYRQVVAGIYPEARKKGEVRLVDGSVIGEHQGIINYTIGQRRGLGIAHGEPLYVVGIDAVRNIVTVGPRADLRRREVRVQLVNWLGIGDSEKASWNGIECMAKLRSTHKGAWAQLKSGDGSDSMDVKVELYDDYYGVNPGQACVFYDGERLLGGGWIVAG